MHLHMNLQGATVPGLRGQGPQTGGIIMAKRNDFDRPLSTTKETGK